MLKILCSPYPNSPNDEKMLITFIIKKDITFFTKVECALITATTSSLTILSNPAALIVTWSYHTSVIASTKLLQPTKDDLS